MKYVFLFKLAFKNVAATIYHDMHTQMENANVTCNNWQLQLQWLVAAVAWKMTMMDLSAKKTYANVVDESISFTAKQNICQNFE